jgi:hypothetical protein
VNNGNAPIPGVGTVAVIPIGFGIGLKNGIVGRHPAMRIDGVVYVHHHHIAAQAMSGTKAKRDDGYGWAELDANGLVVDAYWLPVDPS